MATEIGRLIARFEGHTAHFDAATRRVEQGYHQTSRRMTAEERANVRASEQLQRQKSAAIISNLKANERAFIAAEKAKVRAAEQAAKAQQRAAEQAARASTQAHERFAQRFAVSYNAMKTTALAVFAAIGAGAAGLGLIISRAMSFDVIEKGLGIVAGTAESAKKQLANLKELARLPGLGLREAIQASIALQIGFQSAIKDTSTRIGLAEDVIKQFSNAIALTGGGPEIFQRVITQLTQMSNAGKVLMTDLRPIIQAAPALGQSLQKAFGTISPEEINNLGLTTEQFMRRWIAALTEQPRAVDSAANAWTNFTNTVDQALIKIGRPLLEPLTQGLNFLEPLLDRVGTRTGEIFNQVGADATKLWANLPDSTKAAFADMLATVQGAGGQIVKWFQDNYPQIQEAVTNVLNQIAAFWQRHGDTLKKNFQLAIDQIKNILKLGLDILRGDWQAVGGDMAAILLNNGKRLLAITEQNMALIERAIVKSIPALGKIAYGLGKAIAQGVWEGIRSSETASKVYMWAFELGQAAKQALLIRSPSRVFHQIGSDIGSGLVTGLQSKAGEVQQTLADMLEMTAGQFTKAPKKPTESAAKKIAAMLRDYAEALRQIGGEESAVGRMNRLLADPQVAKQLKERTRQLLIQTAAMIDASKVTRERYAVTRPRRALDPGLETSIRDRIVDQLSWMTGTRARRVGDTPTSDAVDLGGGSFLMEGGTGSERQRRAWGPSEEDLERVRSRVRRLSDDITGMFNRAVVDGLEGGVGAGLKSLGLSVLEFVQNVFLTRLRNALDQVLGGVAMGSGGGFWSGLLRAIIGGAASGAAGGIVNLGGGSTYTPGGTGATRPRIVGRATGGPIWPGQMYQVHKDELIIPKVAGQVIPKGAGQPIVNNYNTFNLPPLPNNSYSSKRSARQQADMILAALQGAQA